MSESIDNIRLHETIAELESATKVLVRRDLELKRAYRQLEEIDERKTEFVSIAAHQLRTPLSAIRWALQMLIDGEVGTVSAEQLLVLQQAQQSILRMVSLVNDLLRADHLEYDKVQYTMQLVDIKLILAEVINSLLPMAQERNILISQHFPDHPVTVMADATHIKEVFLNILSNAIKYSTVRTEVSLTVRIDDGQTVVLVKDAGIGIPEKDQPHIFKKFSRADNARRVDADGSGLGMFIAQKIITGHHGTINFTSEEGKGTVFTVRFPST